MGTPIVSIIMPVRDGERFLPSAIDSVLNQTFEDFEFIIIDDGSIDSTPQKLRSYRDSRIRVVAQAHRGIPSSLNAGLCLARGKYIARQDADDVSKPARLAHQVELLDARPDIGLAGTLAEQIDEEGVVLGLVPLPTTDSAIRACIREENPFVHGSMLLRADVVARVGLYREDFALSQDYELWLRMCESSRAANVGQVLYQYRLWPGSVSQSNAAQRAEYSARAVELANARRRVGKHARKDATPEWTPPRFAVSGLGMGEL